MNAGEAVPYRVSRIEQWRCLQEKTARRWVRLARSHYDAVTEYGELHVTYERKRLGYAVNVERWRFLP